MQELKTVLIFHFDSGTTAMVDVDDPNIDPIDAAKSFVATELLKNNLLWINHLIMQTQKLEYLEFIRVPK